MATPALGATSTSFSPATINLATGQSTTITIAAVGFSPGVIGAQFGVNHNSPLSVHPNTVISNPQCVGAFAGASPVQSTTPTGDILACTFVAGGASGTTGNVMTFVLTNTGGAGETISFNSGPLTFYLTSSFGTEAPGTLNTLTVTNSCILGDINCDGFVDIRDYGIWRTGFGATDCGSSADLDRNCVVDIRDYGIWRTNFGHTAGANAPSIASSAATPLGTPTPIPGPTPTSRKSVSGVVVKVDAAKG